MIISHREKCQCDAMEIFRNERKIESILKITEEVYYKGFEIIRKFLEKDGVKYIDRLPFMGPATSFHLAKNLGLPTVKPDRHLTRVAFRTGYSSPYEMCKTISEIIGDKITVIDLVIWRYATLDPNYLVLFCPSDI